MAIITKATYGYTDIAQIYNDIRNKWTWTSISTDENNYRCYYTNTTGVGIAVKYVVTATNKATFEFGVIYNNGIEIIRTIELDADTYLQVKYIKTPKVLIIKLASNVSGDIEEMCVINTATHKNGIDKAECVGIIKIGSFYTQSVISSPTLLTGDLTSQYQNNYESGYHTSSAITVFVNMYYTKSEYVFDNVYYVLAFQNSNKTSGSCTINGDSYYLQESILIEDT